MGLGEGRWGEWKGSPRTTSYDEGITGVEEEGKFDVWERRLMPGDDDDNDDRISSDGGGTNNADNFGA